MVVLPPAAKDCDATIKIFNPDGSEAEACGNGTRYTYSLAILSYVLSNFIIAPGV